MLHAALIVVHATAATACFAVGLALVIAPPAGPPSRRFWSFAVLALVAMVTLLTVVGSDWAKLDLTKRIAFAALSGGSTAPGGCWSAGRTAGDAPSSDMWASC